MQLTQRSPIPGTLAGLVGVLVTLFVVAPEGDPARAQEIDRQGPVPVASLKGSPIFEHDLEDWARSHDSSNRSRLAREMYELRRRALEGVLGDRLLAAEAASRGLTVQQLIDAEVARRLKPVSGDDVDAFIAANPFPVGTTRDMVAALVTTLLKQRAEQIAKDEFLEALREGKSSDIEVRLESPYVRARPAPHNPVRGPESARVEVVVFSDFECPFCRQADPVLMRLVERFPKDVRLIWKHFPLTIHARAQGAAEAAQCAHDQGRFWEFHDALFADRAALQPEMFDAIATHLGLEAETFASCVRSRRHEGDVASDIVAGESAGVAGTPTVFINGAPLVGALPYETYDRAVRKELDRHP